MNVKKLRKQIDQLRKQLRKAEEAEFNQRTLPKMRAMIGNVYRYKNSYGGNLGSWWMYVRIVGVDDGYFLLATIQSDCDGRITAKEDTWSYPLSENHERITADEYDVAASPLLEKVCALIGGES